MTGALHMPLTPTQIQDSWRDFKVFKKTEARSCLIDHYSYLVSITAGRLVTNVPTGMERDDLVSAGVVGLVKSVYQFDPTRDVKFETYAIALIRGAILEMLRDQDWVPRSIRDKMKALDKTFKVLEKELDRDPTSKELAEAMGLNEEDVTDIQARQMRSSVYSLDEMVGSGSSDGDENINFVDMLSDEDSDTDAEVQSRALKAILASGIDILPDRERLVISLYYYEGLTFREIGKVLGVSESRVYQLHTQAMGRLRRHMSEQGAVA
jgi:RNA polymerase sigma factor for flagellar operon FliA